MKFDSPDHIYCCDSQSLGCISALAQLKESVQFEDGAVKLSKRSQNYLTMRQRVSCMSVDRKQQSSLRDWKGRAGHDINMTEHLLLHFWRMRLASARILSHMDHLYGSLFWPAFPENRKGTSSLSSRFFQISVFKRDSSTPEKRSMLP